MVKIKKPSRRAASLKSVHAKAKVDAKKKQKCKRVSVALPADEYHDFEKLVAKFREEIYPHVAVSHVFRAGVKALATMSPQKVRKLMES